MAVPVLIQQGAGWDTSCVTRGYPFFEEKGGQEGSRGTQLCCRPPPPPHPPAPHTDLLLIERWKNNEVTSDGRCNISVLCLDDSDTKLVYVLHILSRRALS